VAQLYSGILEEMTIDDVRGLDPNVSVIPIGSTEPHGPALPYGTDSFQVEAISYGGVRRANEQGGRVICLPVLRISLNNNFRAFPFACRMSVQTFMGLLKDLVAMCEADGVSRVVFVNGHGGNSDVVRAVLRDLEAQKGHPFACLVDYNAFASPEALSVWENRSDHAGEEETSQVLYLKPNLVRKDKIGNHPQRQPRVEALRQSGVEFVRPWHLYVPASAGGDATRASAEKGKAVIESAIEGMGRFLMELSKAPDSETFPY